MWLLVKEKLGNPEDSHVITAALIQKVERNGVNKKEKSISSAYSVIDNDLARDNVENDLTSADFQDL